MGGGHSLQYTLPPYAYILQDARRKCKLAALLLRMVHRQRPLKQPPSGYLWKEEPPKGPEKALRLFITLFIVK
jgi:hypothetical protein